MEEILNRRTHFTDDRRFCDGKFKKTDAYRQHMESYVEYTCEKCGKVETIS